MKKRVSTFLMALIMAFSLIPILGGIQEAYADGGLTRSDAVSWARAQNGRTDNCDVDGNGLWCTDLATAYMNYLWLKTNNENRNPWGLYPYTTKMAYAYDNYVSGNNNWTVITRNSSTVPLPGDIFVSEQDSLGQGYGHVGIVLTPYGSTSADIIEMSGGVRPKISNVTWGSTASYNPQFFIRFNYFLPDPDPIPQGSEMKSGYTRTIPDGDYIIANTGTADKTGFCFLDIVGTDIPAAAGTNVLLSGPLKEPPACDVWTIKYSNGFYSIVQKGTNISLDIRSASVNRGENVHAWTSNGSAAQKWAISHNGRDGYRIQAKCSGFSLDVSGGGVNSGTNIIQWTGNDTSAQSWMFIPYQPKQPLANGRYVLLSQVNNSIELDVAGDTADVDNGTNVQIWRDTCSSRYNSFDIKKLNNGYYRVIHAASGKALDASGASSTLKSNINLYRSNDTLAQQWAITRNENGYVLRSRCSGYAMDIDSDKNYVDGSNVQQYAFHGRENQTWLFVPAEYTVAFNANGGSGAPPSQTKYYKEDLSLNRRIPFRAQYSFNGWNTRADGTGISYTSGALYKIDSNITFYAQWTKQESEKGNASRNITKQANPLKVKVSNVSFKRSKLKKAVEFSLGVSKAKGTVTYTLDKKAKKAGIIVSKKGKVLIPKKCKKGTYKITVKAAGNKNYKARKKVVTIIVK